MKNFNSFFNQLTAMPKRLAMVLTVLFTLGVGQMWGETATYTLSTSDNGKTVTTGDVQWTIAASAIESSSFKCKLTGTITVSLPTGATLNSVALVSNGNSWGSGATITFKTGTTTLNTFSSCSTFTLTKNKTDLTYSFVKSGTSSKNAWVKSITVDYTATSSCNIKPTVGNALQSITVTENSIEATIPISAVGGCNITENGLVYSTTNSTPTVGGSGCVKVTTTACGSTAANKTVTITELNCGTTYYIRGYATNEAGTSYTNVTTISTSDCPKYTVTLKDDNSARTQQSAGGSVDLPSRDGCDGYTFVGWTKTWTEEQEEWTTTAPAIIPAGSYTPTANESLYPVYTKTEGGGTSYQFQKVTALSQIKAGGTFIITNGSYYLPNAQASSSGPVKANMVAVTNGVVTGAVTDAMKWTFSAADANGKITIKSAANSNYYLYTTNSNGGLRVNNTSDTWTFEEYTVSDILGFAMKSTSNSRYCAVYTDGSDWRSYTTKNATNYKTNSGRLDLYKYTEISSNTTYYISVPNCCTQLAEVTNLVFSDITSNRITVGIPNTYAGKDNASGYTFNCYSASTGGSLVATADEKNGTSHTFTGLTKNTTYYFTVIAKGEGEYCNSIETSPRESSKTLTQYTVTLNPNGGTGNFSGWSNYTMTVDAGTEITLPELSKTGYNFAGWHDETQIVTSPYTPTKDVTLTAQWTANSYTVIFNANGGTGEMDNQSFNYDEEKALSANEFTRKGHTFVNWNNEDDGSGDDFDDEEEVKNLSTINGATYNLYAQWECVTPTISTQPQSATYLRDDDADALSVVAAASDATLTYQWQSSTDNANWSDINGAISATYKPSTQSVGTTYYRVVVTNSDGNCPATSETATITVRAANCKWVETDIADIESGDEVVIAMTKSGYTWALNSSNGTTTYPLAEQITTENQTIVSVVSDPIIWNISGNATDGYVFYPNGSTATWLYCTGSSNTVKVGTGTAKAFYIENNYLKNTQKLTVSGVLVDAYVGVSIKTSSWRHYPTTTGTSVIADQTLKLYKKECLPTGKYWINYDLTNVVCIDNPIKQQISTNENNVVLNFEATGEHNELPTIIIVTNGSTTLAKNTDYTWEDGVLTILNPSQITDNITISIAAQKRKYTVTFDANGHGSNTSQLVTAEGTAFEPTAPTATGYTFGGWYKEPECTTAFDFATPITGDITLYAKWTVNKYTITFKNYDGTVLQSSDVAYGETPSYTGETPTREQTAQYTYTFSGWSPALYPADKDQEYTAQFNTSTRQYTVTWYDGTGNAHKTQTANYNATVALPTTDPEPCDDEYPYFIGWTADPIVGSTTTQPTLVENVKVTGDCDYYAVFAKGEAGGGGSYVLDYTAENLGSSNKWGSYGTAYTHTAKDGSTWVIKAYKSSGMQINTGKNASIKIPSCPSPITSIEITGSTAKAVGLSASDYTGSGTITYIVTGQDNKSQTLDFAGKNVTNGYIVAKSGSISITQITVNFTAPTNYTSFITTCCTSWSAPTLTYTTPLEENGTATPQITGTTHGTVTYESSNPSILSVNSTTGEITAKAPGTAKITATWSGDATYCSVSSTSNVITVKGSFSVIYYSNGGSGMMANQKADENNVIAQLNANQFTRDGYAFVGWNTKANGTGTAYADQATDITLTGNLTLYAQWAAIVTLNDAGNETTTHPATAGGTITLPDGENACDPYEFVGWTTVATGDWNEGINEPTLVATTYTPSAPTTLYAVYKIQSEGNSNAFKLSFESSYGTTYYVGEYGSSPYLRGFSNITKEEAVTFIRTKMYPNDDTKYYIYMEHEGEYLYCSSGNLYSTSSNPSESQGWVFHTVGDKIQIQAINQERYLSFADKDYDDDRINITTHQTGNQKSFNMLSAVTSTYVASPLCEKEITITFETGNGDFVANAPATNPLTVTQDETITLPTCEYPGYEFMGWLKDEQQLDPSDIVGTYYTGNYTVSGISSSITFYAYYKVIPEEVEFTGKDDVELLMYYYDGTENYYYSVSHAAERGELSSKQNCFNATTWTFTNVGNMQYHIQDETGKYLGAYSDGDNDLILSATPKVWTFTEVNGLWKMVCENSPSRALMYISTGKKFANAAISNEGNGAYSYVTLGICPYPTYTTNPVLTQGFVVTSTAMVTSAVDQQVKAASTLTLETRNIELPCTFTITAPNITFYDNTGAEVTQLTASAASEQFELYFAYKPTAENTMEYPTITIVDDEMKTYTIKNRIYARSLPNTFAVVAKVGGMWYALPSQGLNSTDALVGYPVEVDNIADPTAVTAVPANADWSLRQVYASTQNLDRFKTGGYNLVFVNNVSPEKALNPSSSSNYLLTNAQYSNYHNATTPGLYEWTPTTTDLETYQLTNVYRTTKQLNIATNTVFGVHATEVVTADVRFLPIQNRYTPMAAQVVEWKDNSVVIMYNGNPTQTAQTSINGTNVGSVTLANVQKDIAVYELPAEGLGTKPNQTLSVTIGSEKLLLPTPYMVNSEVTDEVLLGSSLNVQARRDIAKVSNLVILKGGKLTSIGAKTNPYTFRNVTIYGGGTLVVSADKGFGANTLTMRVGGVEDGEYVYTYPQLDLNGTINSGNINLDLMTTNDYYYPFSVPYEVTLTDIHYPVEIYGSNVKSTNKGSFLVSYYDGEARSQGNTGWKDVEEQGQTVLSPHVGYSIWGLPKKVSVNGATDRQTYGIHRIPMKKAAGDVMGNETTNHNIDIFAHDATRDNDKGWNFIGNPYLVQHGGMDGSDTDVYMGLLVKEMKDGQWTGGWVFNGEQVRYVTQTNDCLNYTSTPVANATVPAFSAFFIQAKETGAIAFTSPNVAAAQSLTVRRSDENKEITTGIILSGEKHSDRTGLLIADEFTEAYEFNADLSKFDNQDMNLYTISPSGKLAFMAINEELAKQTIPLGYSVSADGMYTIAFDEQRYSRDDIYALYLIDYDRNETTNLLHMDYDFYSETGANAERFALQVAFAPSTTTDIEYTQVGDILVSREGNTLRLDNLPSDATVTVYDAVGHLIEQHTATQLLQLTLQKGYYLLHIGNNQHSVAMDTFIP